MRIIKHSLFLIAAGAVVGCQTTYKAARIDDKSKLLRVQTCEDPNATMPKANANKALDQVIKETKVGPATRAEDYGHLAHLYLAAGDVKRANTSANKALALDFRNREAKLVLAHLAYLGE